MHTRLQLELFIRGIKLADVARRAGVDQAFVSRVVAGKQKCSPKLARAFREFGIEVEGYGQATAHEARSEGRRRHGETSDR